MSRRYYSSYGSKGQSTCSIRSLKKAYIGNGVRMSSDKKTVEFQNLPMKGMVIESYNKQGFQINHPNFPKSVWIDFKQLPLTRLQINNGVIQDEITFVENIIMHQMQLIRTLDTEYIDMIYKEKALETKQDEIIPITQAIPGQVYIGAQCEEGNEMIYLGTFFVKEIKTQSTYYGHSYYRGSGIDKSKTYMHKLSPQRAFFAISAEEVTSAEEDALRTKYYGNGNTRWEINYDQRQILDKKIAEEKKQILANSTIPRYKILEFAVTSKRVKQVILTHKENKAFDDPDMNRTAILASKFSDTTIIYPIVNFLISNNWYSDTSYLSKSKENIEAETRKFFWDYKQIILEEKYFEERYNN